MPFLRFQDVADQLAYVDDPDVLEKAKGNRALSVALEISRPANWRGSGIDPKALLAVADSGIPVAWVPRPQILRTLVSAAPADRVAILWTHVADVIAHCGELLTECRDPSIRGERRLVGRAVEAFKAGHYEAAMALSVLVGETLAFLASYRRQAFESEAAMQVWEQQLTNSKYRLARLELDVTTPSQAVERIQVVRRALIAPIPKFFTPFYGHPGEAIPDMVSRHATVHKPTVEHLTPQNALLAIMLCTSLLRDEESRCEEDLEEQYVAEEH
jgi:hypothetical protein